MASLEECPVLIAGAGLSGCLMALFLAQRNYRVLLVEKRTPVPKEPSVSVVAGKLGDAAKRSINLALSHRGISALKAAGIYTRVEPALVPMKGRMVHDLVGNIEFQPYGQAHQGINSVSRQTINDLLREELCKYPKVKVMYDTKINRVQADGFLVSVSILDVF